MESKKLDNMSLPIPGSPIFPLKERWIDHLIPRLLGKTDMPEDELREALEERWERAILEREYLEVYEDVQHSPESEAAAKRLQELTGILKEWDPKQEARKKEQAETALLLGLKKTASRIAIEEAATGKLRQYIAKKHDLSPDIAASDTLIFRELHSRGEL